MAVVPKVVVVGAGFGGIEVARHLADRPVDLTLVDRNNFHTFQPLLYQVATAGLNAADVAHVVRGLFQGQRNLRFRQATVTGVDWAEHQVLLQDQPPLPFDHLVLAGGAAVTHFGTPGAAEHGFALYTLPDAVQLRNHVVERFEGAAARAAAGEPPEDGALTFVVVGGGPTGVETAGALAELFAQVFRKDYPELDVSRARIVLVELQDHLLAPFSPRSRRHALDTLRSRGVDVLLGTGPGRRLAACSDGPHACRRGPLARRGAAASVPRRTRGACAVRCALAADLPGRDRADAPVARRRGGARRGRAGGDRRGHGAPDPR